MKTIVLLLAIFAGQVVTNKRQVSLAWDASTSADVAGYKIIRAPGPVDPVTGQLPEPLVTIPVGNFLTVTLDVPDGTWYFAVTATDLAGNESAYGDPVISLATDTVAPQASLGLRFIAPLVTQLTATTASIAWKTDQEATGFVALYTDQGVQVGIFAANSTNLTTDHVVVLTGLTSNTKYRYLALSTTATEQVYNAGGSFLTK